MNIIKFFDKLEDKVRGFLSHYPIIYAFIAGIGIVLFWRGVWHTTDDLMIGQFNFIDGPLSFLLGSLILLITGVFVSNFIGNEIIISGLKREKKTSEKTEQEISEEKNIICDIRRDLDELKERMEK